MPGTRFRLTGGLWSSGHCWVGKDSTGRGTSSGGGHCGGSGLSALRGLPQDASPRSAAQHRAHSPGSEGRAMGVGCRAGAQVPRQAGRTGQRLQCTDACADERGELDPTRPRSQPVPARQEPAAPRDQAECCAAGPGWPGWQGTSGLPSGIAHYLEDPQLPKALGRATSRKPEHPGRGGLPVLGRKRARLHPGSAGPRHSPGSDTSRDTRSVPHNHQPSCNAAPQCVCRPPPLPTRTFPTTRFWRLNSPPGHLL